MRILGELMLIVRLVWQDVLQGSLRRPQVSVWEPQVLTRSRDGNGCTIDRCAPQYTSP